MRDLVLRQSHDLSCKQGPNDREVEIWIGNQWVPSFFSQLKAGNFFLDMKNEMPGRCFLCTADVVRVNYGSQPPSFVTKGIEVVQAPVAPSIDSNVIDLPASSVKFIGE